MNDPAASGGVSTQSATTKVSAPKGEPVNFYSSPLLHMRVSLVAVDSATSILRGDKRCSLESSSCHPFVCRVGGTISPLYRKRTRCQSEPIVELKKQHAVKFILKQFRQTKYLCLRK